MYRARVAANLSLATKPGISRNPRAMHGPQQTPEGQVLGLLLVLSEVDGAAFLLSRADV